MDIELKNEEGCKKVYTVSAPWSDMEPRFAEVTKAVSHQVRLPGFRAGKAPAAMVKTRYRKEIREEVLEHLLPEAARALLEKFPVKPVVEPYAEEVHLEEGQDFRCEVAIEVAPEVPEVTADGVSIESPKAEITDEQVQKVVETLRQRAAVMKPREEAAEEGDFAVVTMKRHGQSKDQEIFLSALAASEHPAEKVLAGKKAGESFDLTVEEGEGDQVQPPEAADAKKTLSPGAYSFTVNKVIRREVPELNDDFAKDLGAGSLDDLVSKVRRDMEERVQREVKAMQQDRLLDILLERNPFPVPPTLVERQLRRDLEEMASEMASQGMDPEKANINWEDLAKTRRAIAAHKVAAHFLLTGMADRLTLEATEDDLKAFFAVRAAGTGLTAETLRQRYEKDDRLDDVRTLIRQQKALDLLLSQASVTVNEAAPSTSEV
jgi:trigger factor